VNNEKAELSRRLSATKDEAKKAVEASIKRYVLHLPLVFAYAYPASPSP
jgi:hypothetical protein